MMIYGFIPQEDGVFRIVDRTVQSDVTEDPRGLRTGRMCDTWNNIDLFETMWKLHTSQTNKLELDPPRSADVPTPSRDEMIRFLGEKKISPEKAGTFSDEKLFYFYQWYNANYSHPKLCVELHDKFKSADRILYR